VVVRSSRWVLLPLVVLGVSGCQTAPTAVLPLQTAPPPGISQFIETASFDVEDGSLVVSGKRAFKSHGERVDTLNLKDLDLQVLHHREGNMLSGRYSAIPLWRDNTFTVDVRIPVARLLKRGQDHELVVSCPGCKDPRLLDLGISLSGNVDGRNLIVRITKSQIEEFYSRQEKLTQRGGGAASGTQEKVKEQTLRHSLDVSKMKCTDLGFKRGTEKFADCVLRLSR
jgi:hypothetical protein